MASGKEHGKVTQFSAQALLVGSLLLGQGSNLSIALYAGCMFGLILDPDLDIPTMSDSEGRLVKIWRPLGFVWILVWLPYGKLIPHRSWISHAPIIGTAIRYTYFLLLVNLFTWLVKEDPLWLANHIDRNLITYIYVFFGTAFSDFMHWVLDHTTLRIL